mmetsp:Transcript_708/g.1463  ORF Transcript_708/g.1463 Transcript_708/m.1463 type:complete len:85 (-) Transcript_708:598-852(-)
MRWAEAIEKTIKECKVFVALCTPTHGEREASSWTYLELRTADRLRKPILAVWHSGPFPASEREELPQCSASQWPWTRRWHSCSA